MSAGEYCNRDVVIVSKTEPVREAIQLMRSHHVGDVVVVETLEETTVPVGILTDRDIVLELLAEGVDLDAVSVGDVMSYELVTVTENTKLIDSIKIMRDKGVRRIPVINEAGGLEGLLTMDELLELVAEQLTDIVGLINKEQARESRLRR